VKKLDKHCEDNHGRCAYCLEEWPCAFERGEAGRSGVAGVQAWGQDAMMMEAMEESEKRQRLIVIINRRLEQIGLTDHDGQLMQWPSFATGRMIPVESFAALLALVPPDARQIEPAEEVMP